MIYLAIHPAQACQALFIISTAAGLGTTVFPPLRRLASYGPRIIPASESPSAENNFTVFAKLQVPHTWFTHFYLVSVASSAFWAYQLRANGALFRILSSRYAGDTDESMTINQIVITWVLVAIQGSRRLYESIRFLKPSAAKMPVASYAVGIAFYLALGVAVWAEGIPVLLSRSRPLEQIEESNPSGKIFFAFLLFLIASGIQHDAHVYLASLKKYTLPEHGLFRWILCPHYTSECAIYLAIAVVAAPKGQILNKTMSTVLIFTVVNLAITAEATRAWYAQKFGAEKIGGRSRMLPFIY